MLHAEDIGRGGEWIETLPVRAQPLDARSWPAPHYAGGPGGLRRRYGRALRLVCRFLPRPVLWRRRSPQLRLHAIAYEHVMTNMATLRPGVSFTNSQNSVTSSLQNSSSSGKGSWCTLSGFATNIRPSFVRKTSSRDYVLEPRLKLCVEAHGGGRGV